ncbi:zinc-binding dehydrogenase [Streptosporangium soli]|nr:zinc-binding dehydrogenase [Streptosporangium sp. KLBMP 9127]
MRTQAAVLDHPDLSRLFTHDRPLRVGAVDLEAPGPGELLVSIDAAGVCHSDLSVVNGSRRRPTPMALGHEATGIVEALGPYVTDVEVGDRVVLVFVPSCGLCGHCTGGAPARCVSAARANAAGTLLSGARRLHRDGQPVHHHLGVSAFARHAVVDRRSAVVVPADLPAPVAALFGCAVLTGVGAALNTANVRPGESALVLGLGGVGLCALLGAVLANAHPIIAVDPIPEKRDLALKLGATHAVHPEEVETRLAAVLDGGADVAFEAVGRASALQTAWSHTRPGGRTVSVGLPDPSERLPVPVAALVGEGRTLLGSYQGDSVPQRDIPRYVALWRAGRLPVDLLLGEMFPLSDVNVALERLATGGAVRPMLLP